jgi:L-malate glycosyltransferase
VVASDVGGIPEVIEPGVDGCLVPARDVAAAARCAIEILSRADRGREMGIRARQNAERKYSSRDVIPHYENYYRQVLSAAAARA